MNKKDEKILEILENLGWWYNVYEDDIEIGQYSPAGEDFFFTVDIKDNFAQNIVNYCYNFDIDEHIEMWVVAKQGNNDSGIPSIRVLVKDAEAIKEMLDELSKTILEVM